MSLIRSVNALVFIKTINKLHTAQTTRTVKRWVAPTLRELQHRVKKLGPQKPEPRSGYVEWNYRAELYAFGKRLNEEFQLPLLQTAFTQRSYINQEQERQLKLDIEESDLPSMDNTVLAEKGEYIVKEYVESYLQHVLPKLPEQGRRAILKNLLNTETMARVASELGMTELVFAAEYPPSVGTLEKSLNAVVGALAESSGIEKAFLFVRDFICTQLNQRDLLDLWVIEQPIELLQQICVEKKLGETEPRLLGDCGKNTVLAAFHVGIYANKQLLGKGFGEDIPTATETAALDALQTLFGIRDNMRPFDFQLHVVPKSLKLTQH